jgi:hypothetical protein
MGSCSTCRDLAQKCRLKPRPNCRREAADRPRHRVLSAQGSADERPSQPRSVAHSFKAGTWRVRGIASSTRDSITLSNLRGDRGAGRSIGRLMSAILASVARNPIRKSAPSRAASRASRSAVYSKNTSGPAGSREKQRGSLLMFLSSLKGSTKQRSKMNKTSFISGVIRCDCKGRANQRRQDLVRSTLYSRLWRTTLPGSQQVLALPVSDYMIVEQLERHGLVSVDVPMQTSR